MTHSEILSNRIAVAKVQLKLLELQLKSYDYLYSTMEVRAETAKRTAEHGTYSELIGWLGSEIAPNEVKKLKSFELEYQKLTKQLEKLYYGR